MRPLTWLPWLISRPLWLVRLWLRWEDRRFWKWVMDGAPDRKEKGDE